VELGIPVCAAAPSVTGLFGRQLNLQRALVLCISQSGRSPDILTQAAAAHKSGALCVALVNDQTSPLAELADVVVPLSVGEEKAVAATKSYLATLSAILQLVAFWANNTGLQQALTQLPEQLQQAVDAAPQLTQSFVSPLKHCVVLGRSFGYAISREIALKLKEVLGIHAESFSSAEFLHGPVTLVANKLGVIDIDIEDESATAHRAQIAEIAQRGGIMTQLHTVGTQLHPRTAALTVLQRFYLDIEQIAVSMGRDPDRPVGLNKVTKTV
jgi:glutamine---fructose-6-phosphate transaminase (isomerizing)